MEKLLAALEAESANLNARRTAEIDRAKRMLEQESNSRHLGHNLGNAANEISELAARIEQTQMVLRDLKTRIEFAEAV